MSDKEDEIPGIDIQSHIPEDVLISVGNADFARFHRYFLDIPV